MGGRGGLRELGRAQERGHDGKRACPNGLKFSAVTRLALSLMGSAAAAAVPAVLLAIMVTALRGHDEVPGAQRASPVAAFGLKFVLSWMAVAD